MSETPPISGRAASAFAVAVVVLQGTAGGMYVAAGWSSGTDLPSLLATGSRGAALIRWGSLVDMLGYMAIVPVVLYLRRRYASSRFIDLYAVAGLATALIGCIGAIAMGAAGPPLIHDYLAGDAATREAIQPAFAVLYRFVVLGLWQTLESITAAAWLLGTSTAAWRTGPRAASLVMVAFGLVVAGFAMARIAGA